MIEQFVLNLSIKFHKSNLYDLLFICDVNASNMHRIEYIRRLIVLTRNANIRNATLKLYFASSISVKRWTLGSFAAENLEKSKIHRRSDIAPWRNEFFFVIKKLYIIHNKLMFDSAKHWSIINWVNFISSCESWTVVLKTFMKFLFLHQTNFDQGWQRCCSVRKLTSAVL